MYDQDRRHPLYNMLSAVNLPGFFISVKAENAAQWARLAKIVIMDKTSRVMIQPGSYGLDMPIPEKEPLMPLPRLPKKLLPEIRKAVFTVPYSFIDVVGHMNNTRYVEISENHLEAARLGKEPRDMVIEFTHELRLDESMELEIGQEGDQYSVQGTRNGGPVFTLFITYEA